MRVLNFKHKVGGAVIGLAMVLSPTVAAATISFSWEPNKEPIDGYYLYMDTYSNMILTLPADAVSATVAKPTDGKSHAYYIKAFRGDEVSGNSDLAVWSPEPLEVPVAKTFRITGTLEVID